MEAAARRVPSMEEKRKRGTSIPKARLNAERKKKARSCERPPSWWTVGGADGLARAVEADAEEVGAEEADGLEEAALGGAWPELAS